MNAYLTESGYIKGVSPINITEQTRGITDFLESADIEYAKVPIFTTRKRVKSATEAFFSEYFSLHNVLFLPESHYIGFYGLIKNTKAYSEAIQTYCSLVSPFEVNVKANYHGERSFIEMESIFDPEKSELSEPYFKNVVLKAPFTNTSPCSYAHEIGHTQTDSIYGSVTDYHNKEVISIFLEKLCALSIADTVFHDMQRKRLQYLKGILQKKATTPEEENEVISYIISTLKAEKLFNIYIEVDEASKKLIINMLQAVFDGAITLEKLLEDLDISFDNSLDTSYMKRNLSY